MFFITTLPSRISVSVSLPVQKSCRRTETETASAIVFKTIADPYVGKLSLFRVYSGEVKADSTLFNPNKNTSEKIGKLFILQGKKQVEQSVIKAGDIGAVAKLDKTREETLATAGVDGLSEEDKRRLAEEYLAQLARENAAKAEPEAQDKPLVEENTDKGDEQA